MWSRRIIFKILFILIPSLAFTADEELVDIDFSVYLLSRLFGRLVTDDPAYDIRNTLTFVLVDVTLEICLLAAFTLGAMTYILQTVKGAHDGNLLSKESSSTFNPIKQLAGIALLIPTESGFSYIQSFFMSLVLQGVILANSMWDVVASAKIGNISSPAELEDTYTQTTEEMALSLYKAAGALRIVQRNKPSYSTVGISDKSRLFVQDPNEFVIEIIDVPFNFEYYGRQNIDDVNAQDRARQFFTDLILEISDYSIIRQKYENLFTEFDLAGDSPDIDFESEVSVKNPSLEIERLALATQTEFYAVAKKIQEFIRVRQSDELLLGDDLDNKGGWMTAGFKYWDYSGMSFQSNFSEERRNQLTRPYCNGNCIVKGSRIFIDYLKIFNERPTDRDSQNYYAPLNDFFDIYLQYLRELSGQPSSDILELPDQKTFWEEITATFGSKYGKTLNQTLLELIFPKENFDFRFDETAVDKVFDNKDPLRVFIEHNLNLLVYTFWLILSSVIATGMVSIIAFFNKKAIAPNKLSAVWILIYTFTLLFGLLATLIPPAILGSFFLALMPGVIFFAAALAWIFRVVEVVLIAPLISVIMLLPPSQGQARTRNAANQILVVIFKPALMILGLIMAIRLVSISILFSTATLAELILVVHNNFKGGQFELLFFLGLLYNLGVGLIVAMASRAFGAIHLIPDQVFGVIGVQGEADDESKSFVTAIEQSAKKGAEETTKILTTFINVAGSNAAIGEYKKPKS